MVFKYKVHNSRRHYNLAKLREHTNIHTGLNPFKCDVEGCEQAFPTKDRLRTHAQKHSSKHACDLCGKRFQTDAIRRKHMLTHSAGVARAALSFFKP